MKIHRRELMTLVGAACAGGLPFEPGRFAVADETYSRATRGLPPLKITRVKAILTRPATARLVVVKVETSEPGLYGLGCATFTQRAQAVAVAVDKFLAEFANGRDPDNIEDMWQTAYTSSYWRNGPVLNNALSGLDMALWDIKGKRAGMPIYQLLGGKCRFAVDTYTRAEADDLETLQELVRGFMADGFRHVRIQLGGLTPARKLAALAEHFGVKCAWHGPPDVSPVGHAANAHLDLAISNFGIQEMTHLNQATQDVFPGSPTFKDGYMFVNETPGFGVDIDEQLATKFPIFESSGNWLPVRRSDGSAVRP